MPSKAFIEEQINFSCLQETWLSGNFQCKIKTTHDGKPTSCLFPITDNPSNKIEDLVEYVFYLVLEAVQHGKMLEVWTPFIENKSMVSQGTLT
eukprot:5660236-Ditylum_brightwellii.AAC.1